MMHDAEDIARFIVRRSIDIGRPLTNFRLQEYLYLAWIDYYRETYGLYLFDDAIYAWKLGPVVPDVYRGYRIFAAMPITITEESIHEPDRELSSFLMSFVERNRSCTDIGLIAGTHRDGTPWKKAYIEGRMDVEIPFPLIIRMECQRFDTSLSI